ncbi:hypothetical protein AVEN_44376-1 [Araneus ventricosus]|uniref:Uncharacterized protein n=1 Tax=Araneus ventricosus TaxID=182803 RepID=A0A4Y2QRH8_ARAVE|nr:hypothetical protein AVEN_44376-1 [Araneus ventricosus]
MVATNCMKRNIHRCSTLEVLEHGKEKPFVSTFFASEKSPNDVEFRQISYNHSLGDLARVWFTIGDICAWLTENRFAPWLFTIGDICARLTENRFALRLVSRLVHLATFQPNRFAWQLVSSLVPN